MESITNPFKKIEKDFYYLIYDNRRVLNLAFYHKSAKIRKKNKHRIKKELDFGK